MLDRNGGDVEDRHQIFMKPQIPENTLKFVGKSEHQANPEQRQISTPLWYTKKKIHTKIAFKVNVWVFYHKNT